MSVRKTVTLTTSANAAPAAASTRAMFANTCRACATTSSPPTRLPVAVDRDAARDEEQVAGADRVGVVADRLGEPGDADLLALAHPAPRADRAQRRARRDRLGVDAQREQRRPPARERALERRRRTRPSRVDGLAVRAERARVGGEVGVDEVGADDAPGELPLLVHADRPVHAVVDDEDDDRQVVLHRRRELLARSSGSRRRRRSRRPCAPGATRLRGDRRRHAVAHRAARRRELASGSRGSARSGAPRR